MPVEVVSAEAGCRITHCTLDIDIHKNEPRVLKHERRPNPDEWRGTSISVVISGNWTNYKSKIINYLRQLAVITPYAKLKFNFMASASDKNKKAKDLEMEFNRRSDQCPPPPTLVKHHPKSVDNLVMESLVSGARQNLSLVRFLSTQLSSISKPLASRLVTELG
jgi:DNA topoisomerase VI subunit B